MEIRILFSWICINICVLILSCLEGKTISLNDLIAAENQGTRLTSTTRKTTPKISTADTADCHGKIASLTPFQPRTFESTTHFRLKKLKGSQNLRNKNKNLTKKREISNNDKIIQKYIPLLKNIRLLFDNILSSDSSETFERQRLKYKRNPFVTHSEEDIICTCERKSNPESTFPQEEAIATSTPATTEIETQTLSFTIATTASTLDTINDNVSSFRRYKDVPILFTRNSIGIRRNDSGFSERSSTSYNRSFEGYHAGDNGNSECNTRREIKSYTKNNEEHTNSDSRNGTSSDGSYGRIRGIQADSRDTDNNRETGKTNEFVYPSNETFETVTRNISYHEGEIELTVRRNETESSLFLPEFDTRLREFDFQEKNNTIRTTEINEKNFLQDSTSNKRDSNRNGSFTTKNQKTNGTDKTIAPKHLLPNSTIPTTKVVMIFDGYSVARDVNGDNKLSEKAIHILT